MARAIVKFIKKNYVGYLLVSPLILGLVLFTFYPIILSLYYSFFDYDFIGLPEKFRGFDNYLYPFKHDFNAFSKSIMVTFTYTVISIPLVMCLSYLLALLLNRKMKGMKVFTVLFYLPVLIPTIVFGILWKDVFTPSYGIANAILKTLHLPTSQFFAAASSSMPTFIFMNLFGIGGGVIMWLAALRSIPATLYEAAEVDGANKLTQLIRITIPMSTPYIFYILITGIISSLQTFGGPFVLMNGSAGVDNSLLFYVMKIYFTAFNSFKVGIASALSWILFIIIGILTLLVFKTSKWVYYGGDQ